MIELAEGMCAIFENHRDDFEQRLNTVEEAVAAILDGSLSEELRAAAERDAHKLAGSLGTFGIARGSELACKLEQRFAPGHRSLIADEAHLAQVMRALRRAFDEQVTTTGATPGPGSSATATEATPGYDERALERMSFDAGLAAPESGAETAGRILVVDDDMPVRKLLAAMLSDAGYDVVDVGSAQEARETLAHDTIALLLSDVSMPGETGLELIRFALSEHPDTATLLISALEDPGIAEVAMQFGAYGYLSKPVRRTAVLIGVMNAMRRRNMESRERAARDSLERTVALRTLALTQALDRLENAGARGRVRQAETIHRWAQASEYRDRGIADHVRRMSGYCALLGKWAGLHAESLELASVLHDVGKVAIVDTILLKPGPLMARERTHIETHADIGHAMLRDSCSSVLDLAAVIAWTHHERFDGGGYPRRLSGSAIPIVGRIAAIADVFDALTSDRVYRSAYTVDDALEMMALERDKHFDAELFDGFLALMDDVLAVRAAGVTR